jgi:hypothetical protein
MMRQALKSALKAVGLHGAYRRLHDDVTRWASSTGRTRWTPLVPEDAFLESARLAVRTLKDGGHTFGDYLEFGVSRGTSMALMRRALGEAGLGEVRAVGFDSFEGMPPESAKEGWLPGEFHSTIEATRRYLAANGADLARIELVKGWFSDTCTPETTQRLGLKRASIIMIDCDIYTASCEALAYAGSFIGERAILILDDWGWRSNVGERGQQEAFEEFMAARPDLSAAELPAYRPEARMFDITRTR